VSRLFTCIVVVALAAGAAGPVPPSVQCLRIGEGTETGRLVAVHDGMLALEQDAATTERPLDGFRELVFGPVAEPALPPPLTVWTPAGRRLAVRRFEAPVGQGTASLVGYGWHAEGLPLSSLRAIAARSVLQGAPEERAAFEEARAHPPEGQDLLTAARSGRRQTVSCVVEGFNADGVELTAADRRRSLPWDDVEWLVLSPTPGPDTRPAHLALLTDGTAIALDSFELADGVLSGVRGDAHWTVEAKRLARIRLASEAYRYLSDLEPAKVITTPLLDVVWAPRLDAAVTGSPLRLGGVTYPKGIGMHVRTEMEFALDGGYSRLYALVGVDDAAGKLGAVVFRVVADGRTAFESPPQHGGDAPLRVSVDITGATRVTLAAEAADPAALSGQFADWADARVVAEAQAGPGE
jgi:hypothetical protein